jgi:hypothetical protein
VAEKRLDLNRLASDSYRLDDISQAFAFAASGEGLKIMIAND